MKKRRIIKIERLKIRLRGISPEEANIAANELGRELISRLVGEEGKKFLRKSQGIGHIDAGAVSLTRSNQAPGLSGVIAKHTAAAIHAGCEK